MAEEREKNGNRPEDRPRDAPKSTDRPTDEEVRRTEDALRDRGPDER